MAEPRRIELMSVEPTTNGKRPKKRPATVRLELSLTATTEESCPEFSYVELVKKNKSQEAEKNGVPFNDDDPFGGDDHDKLWAIAREFEEKYVMGSEQHVQIRRTVELRYNAGGKPGKGKRFISDLIEMGDGYDTDDPFVDNSEAYDEVLPDSMTTERGGFYINTGKLILKEDSDDEDDYFSALTMKRKKKMKKKKFLDGDLNEKKRKKLDGTFDTEKKKKRKLGLDGEVKKRGRPKLYPGNEAPKKPNEATSPKPASSNLSTIPEDVLNSPSSSSNMATDVSMATLAESITKPSAEEGATPNLPDNLPSTLYGGIDKLKQAAKESVAGKCKFFSPAVNKMLLDVELQLRTLKPSVRNTIYSHLAGHLPCGKETLVKRAKKLRLNPTGDKIKQQIEKLSGGIAMVMPGLNAKHEEECRQATEARDNKLNGEKEKAESCDGQEAASTESDDESKKEGGEKEKRFMLPRRKFEWNKELSAMVGELVRSKMESYEQRENRTATPEEYLRTFLDTEVKPLWPKGWIQTRMLYKETRGVHSPWTNPAMAKSRKSLTGSRPGTPSNTSSLLTISQLADLSSSSTPTSALSTPKTNAATPAANKAAPGSGKLSAAAATPNLLDYAEGSFTSKAKGHVTSSGTKGQPGLSFTTTNTLGSGIGGTHTMQNTGLLADKKDKLPDITVSSPTTPQNPPRKTSTPAVGSVAGFSGFMASFQEFALKSAGGSPVESPEKSSGKSPEGRVASADSTQTQVTSQLRTAVEEGTSPGSNQVDTTAAHSISQGQSASSSVSSILDYQTPTGPTRPAGAQRSILGQMATPQQCAKPDTSPSLHGTIPKRSSGSQVPNSKQSTPTQSTYRPAISLSSAVNQKVSSAAMSILSGSKSSPSNSSQAKSAVTTNSPQSTQRNVNYSPPSGSKLCPITGQFISSSPSTTHRAATLNTAGHGAASPTAAAHVTAGQRSGSPASAGHVTAGQRSGSPASSGHGATSQRSGSPATAGHGVVGSQRSSPGSVQRPALSPHGNQMPSQHVSAERKTLFPQTKPQSRPSVSTSVQLGQVRTGPSPGQRPTLLVTTTPQRSAPASSQRPGSVSSGSVTQQRSGQSPVSSGTVTQQRSGTIPVSRPAQVVRTAGNSVSSTNQPSIPNSPHVTESGYRPTYASSPGAVSSSSGARKTGALYGQATTQQPSSCMRATTSPSRNSATSSSSSLVGSSGLGTTYGGYTIEQLQQAAQRSSQLQTAAVRSPVTSPSQAALWRTADHVSSSSAFTLPGVVSSASSGLYLQQPGQSSCQQVGYGSVALNEAAVSHAAQSSLLSHSPDALLHSNSLYGQQGTSPVTHNLSPSHLLGHHTAHHAASTHNPLGLVPHGNTVSHGLTPTQLTYGLQYADSQSQQRY